jgi:hypothetical protein
VNARMDPADPVQWLVNGGGPPAVTHAGTPADDNVLAWLRGDDDFGERDFAPMETVVEAEDVTMEPVVITVSKQRREALLRRAGWTEVNVQFLIRDFNNENLINHFCLLQFTGPRGESYTDGVPVRAGIATYSSFWIKPNGVLRVLAVPLAGTGAQGGPVLEGTAVVPGQIRGRYLAFNATQDHEDIQVRASNQQQVSEQMQVQGNAKFSILKVVELGGGVSKTRGGTQTVTGEFAYTVRVGRSSLVIAPAQR